MGFQTNFRSFFDKIVRLPHGTSWLWNQSNAKVQVELEEYSVQMQKMNTRRKKNGPKAPFYKLWLYTLVGKVNGAVSTQFIWCEKGDDEFKDLSAEKICSPTLSTNSDSTPCFSLSLDFQIPRVAQLPELNTVTPIDILPQNTEILDIDSILFPSYSYSDDCTFVQSFVEDYSAETFF